jgi:hypothetical protein
MKGQKIGENYIMRSFITCIRSMSRRKRCMHVASISAYTIFVEKPKGKRQIGSLRRMWEDNIKLNLIEIEWDGAAQADLAQDRDQWRALVNTVMNLRVP